jgi:putative FmdB family regulatory protein
VPTYQYACTTCDHRFDAVQAFSDGSLTECPECGGALRKVFSSVGVVFKGSGFYRTDSREKAAAGVGATAPAANGSGESSSSKESGSGSSNGAGSDSSKSTASDSSKSTASDSSKSTASAAPVHKSKPAKSKGA